MYVESPLLCFDRWFRLRFSQGKHYGVPGVNVDGQDMMQMLSTGRAVTDYVRKNGPAILQVRRLVSAIVSLACTRVVGRSCFTLVESIE